MFHSFQEAEAMLDHLLSSLLRGLGGRSKGINLTRCTQCGEGGLLLVTTPTGQRIVVQEQTDGPIALDHDGRATLEAGGGYVEHWRVCGE